MQREGRIAVRMPVAGGGCRKLSHPRSGRLEHLRCIALGFRNLVDYRLRSLLEVGGFRPLITLFGEEPLKLRERVKEQINLTARPLRSCASLW